MNIYLAGKTDNDNELWKYLTLPFPYGDLSFACGLCSSNSLVGNISSICLLELLHSNIIFQKAAFM